MSIIFYNCLECIQDPFWVRNKNLTIDVTMKDKAGWACKVGYYGRGREPDKVYYHCAGSYEDRLTLGFVIPHLELWRNMIEDISGEDATSYQ